MAGLGVGCAGTRVWAEKRVKCKLLYELWLIYGRNSADRRYMYISYIVVYMAFV